jgi:hypothetical protein
MINHQGGNNFETIIFASSENPWLITPCYSSLVDEWGISSVISHVLPVIDDDCIEALTNSECHFVTMKKEIIM